MYPRNLLWIDSLGGLAVGSFVLLTNSWLVELHNVPVEIILLMGVANVAYGGFSGSIAVRRQKSRFMLYCLITANALWPLVCLLLTVSLWSTISVFGVIHLLGEGIYVGALAMLEWKNRAILLGQNV